MEKITYPDDVTLFLDEWRGIHIPKNFAEGIKRECIIDREKWEVELDFLAKASLETEGYWETWQSVLDDLKVKIGRRTYFFYQNGSVWMIRDNEKTRKEFFKNVI